MSSIEDKILEIMRRSQERKERLLNGESTRDTIDKIDNEVYSEVTDLLRQQSQECIQVANKKKRIRLAAPSVETKQE